MSTAIAAPFQLLYVSRSAPGIDDASVGEIATTSREKNAQSGISGALLFDGRRFSQLLEGSESAIHLLMARIHADPRHVDVVVTAANEYGLPRLTMGWRLARCRTESLDAMFAYPRAVDEVALALFMSALALSDDE